MEGDCCSTNRISQEEATSLSDSFPKKPIPGKGIPVPLVPLESPLQEENGTEVQRQEEQNPIVNTVVGVGTCSDMENGVMTNGNNTSVVISSALTPIHQSQNCNGHNNNINSGNVNNDTEEEQEFVRLWKASPFAVGYTKPTWAAEKSTCASVCRACVSVEESRYTHVYATACCCQYFPTVGRVGNLVVLRQRMVKYDEEEDDDMDADTDHEQEQDDNVEDGLGTTIHRNSSTTTTSAERRIINTNYSSTLDSSNNNSPRPQRRRRRRGNGLRPKLLCVVGPYFVVTALITIPVLVSLTGYTFYKTWWKRWNENDENVQLHPAVVTTWSFCSFAMFASLFRVACSDPGVLYRHARIPIRQISENGDDDDDDVPAEQHDSYYQWRWNDQALTFRPPGARFDPEVQAVVQQFDHTCPWVGTAIGKGNMVWFQRFLLFLCICVVYDIILITSV